MRILIYYFVVSCSCVAKRKYSYSENVKKIDKNHYSTLKNNLTSQKIPNLNLK